MLRFPAAAAIAALVFAPSQDKPRSETLDFKAKSLPAGWSLTSKQWKIEEGELRGEGDGALERTVPLTSDFTLKFDAWTEEKANVEVKVYAAKDGKELLTFAFLGRYHSVLDGVKSCILKEAAFARVDPKMWIFPGRMFHFEVRCARGQYQMFLNDELGPFFVDPAPADKDAAVTVKILVAIEGKKDKIRIDNVELTEKK